MRDEELGLSTLTYERALHQDGISSTAGVDEVGRGALAGPLVAAAVMLPPVDILKQDAAFWQNVRDS